MRIAFICAVLLADCLAVARASGISFIDRRAAPETNGAWAAAASPGFPAGLTVLTAAGALWEGGDDRLGRALWQSLDADAISGASTLVLKESFQRERPSRTGNPNEWFKGPQAHSFPSGDVSATAALVTPLILEYREDHPSIYFFAALPVFDMAARVEAQAHWQTDVLAGGAVGMLSAYFARRFKEPLILRVMPKGFALGLRRRF
ncbi:MAG: phosphatase PAP2 family protein [Elusimicrobiota bacterium]